MLPVNRLSGGKDVLTFQNTFYSICLIDIDYGANNIKFMVDANIQSAKRSNIATKCSRKLMTKVIDGNSFESELIRAFLTSGIPLSKVEYTHIKVFITKCTGINVPSRVHCRKTTLTFFSYSRKNQRKTKISLIFDEARDCCGRSLVGILVQKLDCVENL